MQDKEQPKGIRYKINENGFYYVYAREWNGKTFYNVKIQQTNPDGTKTEFFRQLKFVKCEPPHNGDRIKIISGFESNYANNKDPYNCITCICVTEWQLESITKSETSETITEYNKNVDTNDIVITSDDLPF